MKINTFASNKHKKDEDQSHQRHWLAYALRAIGFFLAIILALALCFRALFVVWPSAQTNAYVLVWSSHLTVALMLWWQLWLYGHLFKTTGHVLKKSAFAVALTVLSWELLAIVILRITGNQLLSRPSGTVGLLLVGVAIGTLAIRHVFSYTHLRSALLALACVAGLFPIFQVIGLLGFILR